MKILFLDDDPLRHAKFRQAHIGCDVTYVWTAEEAIEELSEAVFDQASLDHDLAAQLNMELPPKGEGSGYDVALFISLLPKERRPRLIVLHSFNPAGATRMAQALMRCQLEGMKLHRIPFDY